MHRLAIADGTAGRERRALFLRTGRFLGGIVAKVIALSSPYYCLGLEPEALRPMQRGWGQKRRLVPPRCRPGSLPHRAGVGKPCPGERVWAIRRSCGVLVGAT
jgi:hypothetical protein